ncbi:hypothetical protein H072_6676 [Dactylellina haptotyla CBS 200.50]|uniref:Uncharacterized protein n=1 Tax=Dactylellina haptotyla (strain CBS 200.50) TaxID=1284197 RepID=S8A972_DACHA|nr:hypothetical protein H072_6676 [Dactylellina haptotyla CBS 200.50]
MFEPGPIDSPAMASTSSAINIEDPMDMEPPPPDKASSSPPETSENPSSLRGDEEFHMFVNLDLRQVLKYPLDIGGALYNNDALYLEQWAIRKGFSELVLQAEYRSFERQEINMPSNTNHISYRLTNRRREILDLPPSVLLRIIEFLHPATCLLLAYGFLSSGFDPNSASAENQVAHTRLLRYRDEFTEVQAPRTIWTGHDPLETTSALNSILSEAGTYPVPKLIVEYAQRSLTSDDIWFSYNQYESYAFYDHASEDISRFDVQLYTSPDGPPNFKTEKTPPAILEQTMFLFGPQSLLTKTDWAGRSVSVAPYVDFEEAALSERLEAMDLDGEVQNQGEERQDMINDITGGRWRWSLPPSIAAHTQGGPANAQADPAQVAEVVRLIHIRQQQLIGWIAIFGAHMYFTYIVSSNTYAELLRLLWNFML